MASSSPNSSSSNPSFPHTSGFDSNTTFIQADPSSFRAVVQRLTGPENPSRKPNSGNMGPGFKRMTVARKLEIELSSNNGTTANPLHSPSSAAARKQRSFVGDSTVMASPVSPWSAVEEEEKAIAKKGFYVHPSPRGSDPPELLPLFPLNSPADDHNHHSSS